MGAGTSSQSLLWALQTPGCSPEHPHPTRGPSRGPSPYDPGWLSQAQLRGCRMQASWREAEPSRPRVGPPAYPSLFRAPRQQACEVGVDASGDYPATWLGHAHVAGTETRGLPFRHLAQTRNHWSGNDPESGVSRELPTPAEDRQPRFSHWTATCPSLSSILREMRSVSPLRSSPSFGLASIYALPRTGPRPGTWQALKAMISPKALPSASPFPGSVGCHAEGCPVTTGEWGSPQHAVQ